jgi:hypothetical protein
MAWASTPPTVTHPPDGWKTIGGGTTTLPPGRGWIPYSGAQFADAALSGAGTLTVVNWRTEFRPGNLTGSGTLSATVLPRPAVPAGLSGAGALAGPYTLLQNTHAGFTGNGTLYGFGVPATAYPQFSGSGQLAGLEDGLTAVINKGAAVNFTGGGVLSETYEQIEPTVGPLSGDGALSATAATASVPVSAALTGSGALSAVVWQLKPANPALTGAGTLSGTGFSQYSTAAAFTGAGTMSATGFASYASAAGFTGAGTLSATAVKISPVAFVANAQNHNTGNQSTISTTLNTTGVNFLVVIVASQNATAYTGTSSCTCAGTAMTSPGGKQVGGTSPGFYYEEIFILANPPVGTAQTITFTNTATIGGIEISAQGYSGVNSSGTVVKNSATTGTSLSSGAITSAANHMVAQGFTIGSIGGSIAGYSGTSRYNTANTAFWTGDTAGAASVTFTGLGGSSGYWSSMAIDLSP